MRKFSENFYKRFNFRNKIQKANFFKAHQYCQLHNLELLTIDSNEEEIAFLNLLNSKGESTFML